MKDENVVNLELEKFFRLDDENYPLRNAAWRGCVLDRDDYSNLRLPKLLWEELISCASCQEVIVCGYYSGVPNCASIKSTWSEYSNFMMTAENYSPEYVIHGGDMHWVVWADLDVTTVAMSQELADRLDSSLQRRDTSLKTLTLESFPSFNEDTFVARIVGNNPEQAH